MHQMDDVTAEVDEREEYSNDFDDETVSRGACKLSDLAKERDIRLLAHGSSEVKQKEESAGKEDELFESMEDPGSNQHVNQINTTEHAAAQGCIQEVLKVQLSSHHNSDEEENKEIIFREVTTQNATKKEKTDTINFNKLYEKVATKAGSKQITKIRTSIRQTKNDNSDIAGAAYGLGIKKISLPKKNLMKVKAKPRTVHHTNEKQKRSEVSKELPSYSTIKTNDPSKTDQRRSLPIQALTNLEYAHQETL